VRDCVADMVLVTVDYLLRLFSLALFVEREFVVICILLLKFVHMGNFWTFKTNFVNIRTNSMSAQHYGDCSFHHWTDF